MRPLHILVFLAPLIVLYEIGSALYLTRPGVVETIGAKTILGAFFSSFGLATVYLPGITLVVVLLAWHFLVGDKWKVRANVLIGMALESAIWALPLLVLALIFGHGRAAMQAEGVTSLASLSWQEKLTLSIGAGIYEELLFRLIMLVVLHFVFVDVLRLSHGVGNTIAAVISAVAFAIYHPITLSGGGVDLHLLGFYVGAGLYFAGLFLMRGFGIVVGAHAVYDVIALLR